MTESPDFRTLLLVWPCTQHAAHVPHDHYAKVARAVVSGPVHCPGVVLELWDCPTGRELRLAAALWMSAHLGLLGSRPDYPEAAEVGLWDAVDEARSVLDWRAPNA